MRSCCVLAVLCVSWLAAPALASEVVDRAAAALEAGDPDAAAGILEPAHRVNPRDAAVAYLLGVIELARGNAERALDLSETAVRHGDDDADHHFLLGTALAANIDSVGALGKFRAARRMRAAWERAVELDADHLNARLALVGYYARAPGIVGGGRDKADAMAADLAGRDPVSGHRARAMILRLDDDDEGALREYDAALGVPDSEPEVVADIQMTRGFLCQELERWDCAHDSFTGALAADPEQLRAWYQVGRTAVFSGERIDDGIAGFERYIAGHTPTGNDPSLAWAHTRLGTLHEKRGDADAARAAYRAALALEPDHEGATEALAALNVQ